MLDRTKLIKELQKLDNTLFIDTSSELQLAKEVWNRIVADPTFMYKVRTAQAPWPIPTWEGKLNDVIPVKQGLQAYSVVSVDGSQIYPDRHQGTGCFLINVGAVTITYGTQNHGVHLSSVPYVFTGDAVNYEYERPTELVDCRRQEFELNATVVAVQQIHII